MREERREERREMRDERREERGERRGERREERGEKEKKSSARWSAKVSSNAARNLSQRMGTKMQNGRTSTMHHDRPTMQSGKLIVPARAVLTPKGVGDGGRVDGEAIGKAIAVWISQRAPPSFSALTYESS